MFMKNKALIAANLECHMKEKELRVFGLRGGSEGGRRQGGSTPEAGVSPAVARFGHWSEKKMLKKYVRSRNVYENKQISDTIPGKKSDIYVLDSDIYV